MVKIKFSKRLVSLRPGGGDVFKRIHNPDDDTISDDPSIIVDQTKQHWKKIWDSKPFDQRAFDSILRGYGRRINQDISLDITDDVVEDVLLNSYATSPGPDGFTFGLYRACFGITNKIFKSIISKLLNGCDDVPSKFSECLLYFLPKKPTYNQGDLSAFAPWALRPITVSQVCIRLLSNMFSKILIPVIDEFLDHRQTAYISGRQISRNVIDVNDFFYKNVEQNKQAYILFIDFESAFSSVSQGALIFFLLHIGFSSNWVSAISVLFRASQKLVLNRNRYDFLSICDGVKQGDHCSPLLSIMMLDLLMHSLDKIAPGGGSLGIRAYADDLVVMLEDFSPQILRRLIKVFGDFERAANLKVNMGKCSILPTFEVDNNFIATLQASRWSGLALNIKGKDVYLGIPIGKDVTLEDIWDKPVLKIDNQFQRWWNVKASQLNMVRIFNIFLLPIISYVAQFFIIPDKIIWRIMFKATIFVFRTMAVPNGIFCSLDKIGLKEVLKHPEDFSLACLLRNSLGYDDLPRLNPLNFYYQVDRGKSHFGDKCGNNFDGFVADLNENCSQKDILRHLNLIDVRM